MDGKYWIAAMSIAAATVLVAGCGGGSAAAPAATTAPAVAAAPAATAAPKAASSGAEATKPTSSKPVPTLAAQPAATPKAEAAVTSDSNPPEADPQDAKRLEAVKDIKSFRYNIDIKIDGKKSDGESTSYSMQMLSEETRDPQAAHYKLSGTGDLGGESPAEDGNLGGGMEVYEVDGTTYMKLGPSWQKFEGGSSDFGSAIPMAEDPADIAVAASTAQKIGTENVNGRSATHYRFDKSALQKLAAIDATNEAQQNAEEGQSEDLGPEGGPDVSETDMLVGAESAQMDIWLDNQYKIVVKYSMNAKGTFDMSQDKITGTMNMSYEAKDLNGNFTITVPKAVRDSATGL